MSLVGNLSACAAAKNFANRSRIGIVIAMVRVAHFLTHSVLKNQLDWFNVSHSPTLPVPLTVKH